MKVLWITERWPPDRGGAAASARRQVEGLSDTLERIDVLRLTDALPPGQVLPESSGPVSVHSVGRARAPEESLQLLAQVALGLRAEHSHDLVQGFYAVHAGYVAAFVGRACGIPSVVSLRGNDLDRAMFHGPRLTFLLWTLQQATALTGVSKEILAKAGALSGRTEGLHRVPNGVDTERFRPPAEGESPPEALRERPRPWIAFSGELRFKKGLPVILELAERLATRSSGTLLWIGGVRREERGEIERWRRASPAASARVLELPYTDDPDALAALCRAADLFVFPSLWDGLPNAILEAMASARPVLAASVGAIPEVIDDGETGFLLPPQKLGGFAREALRIAALEPAELLKIGMAARDKVRREFTPAIEREAILRVYRNLVS